MKAARFHGQKDIRIDDIPEPRLRPGAVITGDRWGAATPPSGSSGHIVPLLH
jgi:hypothetical protein